jgi:hypothetical protein
MDLTTCFGGGLSVVMAGDFNVKHMDWNSTKTWTGTPS